MSAENIQAFLAKVESDEALKKEVSEITSLPTEEAGPALEALAAKVGTPFTAAELVASGAELSDAALEQVAGGGLEVSIMRYFLSLVKPDPVIKPRIGTFERTID